MSNQQIIKVTDDWRLREPGFTQAEGPALEDNETDQDLNIHRIRTSITNMKGKLIWNAAHTAIFVALN